MANDLLTQIEALAVRVEYRDGKPVDYVRKDEVLAQIRAAILKFEAPIARIREGFDA